MSYRNYLPALFLFTLLLGGCAIFSGGGGGGDSILSENLPELIFSGKNSAQTDLNFNDGNFSFFLAKESGLAGDELTIHRSGLFSDFPWQNDYLILSNKYSINAGKQTLFLTRPATISFKSDINQNHNDIFAFVRNELDGWLIYSPDPASRFGQQEFNSHLLSTWFLVRRGKSRPSAPLSAPDLVASPSIIFNTPLGFPDRNVRLNSGFSITGGNLLAPENYDFYLELISDRFFSLTLVKDKAEKSFAGTAEHSGRYMLRLPIFQESFFYTEVSGNQASVTAILDFAGQKSEYLPETIIARVLLAEKNGPVFTKNLAIQFVREIDPTIPPPLPPVASFALDRSFPRNNDRDLAPDIEIKLSFNQQVATETLLSALKTVPPIIFAAPLWNASETEVILKPLKLLTGKTQYTLSLGRDLTSVKGASSAQVIEIVFSTRDTDPPGLDQYFPQTGSYLARNGDIILRFSEEIAPSSLNLSLIPAAEYDVRVQGLEVIISPKNEWQADTDYQLGIASGLQDKIGNATTAGIDLVFSVSALVAAKLEKFVPANDSIDVAIDSPIMLYFDQKMDADSVNAAISFSDNLPPAVFQWDVDFRILTLNFPTGLPYGESCRLTVSSAGTSASGAKLAGIYSTSFKTMTRPTVLESEVFPASDAIAVASNAVILIPFSRSMNQNSAQQAFSLIDSSGNLIQGNFNWNGNRMYFSPVEHLFPGKAYKALLKGNAADADGIEIGQNYEFSFQVAFNAKTKILSVFPVDGADQVPFDQTISIDFSGPIKEKDFVFKLVPEVQGRVYTSWSNSNRTVTITFEAGLQSNTSYIFSVSAETLDAYEQRLESGTNVSFSTEKIELPRVKRIDPANGSNLVKLFPTFAIEFDAAMDRASVESNVKFSPALVELEFVWANDDMVLNFSFKQPLDFSQDYNLAIDSKAKSVAGFSLVKEFQSTFTTRPQTRIVSVNPASGAANINPGSKIEIVFSETMQMEETESAFWLKADNAEISGQTAWQNDKLIFSPNTALPLGGTVNFGFSQVLRDYEKVEVKSEGHYSFTVEEAPAVTSIIPADGASGIGTDSLIILTFNKSMQQQSGKDACKIKLGIDEVEFSATWISPQTLQLKPAKLEPGKNYRVEVNATALDMNGNSLQMPFSSGFNTKAPPAFTVTIVEPLAGLESAELSQAVVALFSNPVETGSIAVSWAPTPPSGLSFNWSQDNRQLNVSANEPLEQGKDYQVKILDTTRDIFSSRLAAGKSVIFSTKSIIIPIITEALPAPGSQNLPLNQVFTLKFNEPMERTSVENAMVIMPQNGLNLSFQWTADNKIVEISLSANLNQSTAYQIKLATTAKSEADISLAGEYVYSFSTRETQPPGLQEFYPGSGVTLAKNGNLLLKFNEEIVPASLQLEFTPSADFTTSFTGAEVVVSPTDEWTADTDYLLRIKSGLSDLLGNLTQSDLELSFSVISETAVKISQFVPANNIKDAPINFSSEFHFDAAMNRDSVKSATTFSQNLPEPEFSWSDDNKILTLNFPAGLPYGENFKVTVSDQALAASGARLAGVYVYSFNTLSRPKILTAEVFPADTAENIASNATLLIPFSRAMNETVTRQAFSLLDASDSQIQGTHGWVDNTLSFSPLASLFPGATYKMSVDTSAIDQNGINIGQAFNSSFKVALNAKTEILSLTPGEGEKDIPVDQNFNITFSAPINPQNFVFAIAPEVSGDKNLTWSDANRKVEISYASFLNRGTNYAFSVSQQTIDAFGQTIKNGKTVNFTTVPTVFPKVTAVEPGEGSLQVLPNSKVLVQFDVGMNKTSVENSLNFSPLTPQATYVWSDLDRKLEISFASLLDFSREYVLNIGDTAESQQGIKLESNFQTRFTTRSQAEVISFVPASGSADVSTNTKIEFQFSAAVNQVSAQNSFRATMDGIVINGTFAWSGNKLTFTPDSRLQAGKKVIAGFYTSVNDESLLPVKLPGLISFTCEVAPAVVSLNPNQGASGVATETTIVINFNKPMQALPSQNAFRLTQNLNNVACSFTWLTPQSLQAKPEQLQPGKTYVISISTSAADQNGNPLPQVFSSTFSTVSPPAFTAEITQPQAGLTDLPLTQSVTASFSNPLDPASIFIEWLPAPPSGYSTVLSENNRLLQIKPTGQLNGGQLYSVRILAATRDIFASTLSSDLSVSFTTENQPAPEILKTVPVAGSLDLPLSQDFTVTFSRSMNRASVENAFSIQPNPGSSPSFTWSADSLIATISFTTDFNDATAYQVIINSTARANDDVTMATNYLLPFQTVARPVLLSDKLLPADQASGVAIQTSIKMIFSKQMNLSSVENAFAMKKGSEPVNGTFSQNDREIIFTPSAPLAHDQLFSLSINSSAADLTGNLLKSPYDWSFTTAAEQGKIWKVEVEHEPESNVFSSRSEHEMIYYKGDIYLIGGYDGEYLNDVWQSKDGKNWTEIRSPDPDPDENAKLFPPRAGHACTVFANEIWLTGGLAETADGLKYYDDVWHSSDGITWKKANDAAEYYQRAFHNLVVFNNKLWIIAGESLDGNTPVLLDDCWSSSDGVSWSLKSQIVSFYPRKNCHSAVLNGKLWVWGGFGQSSTGQTIALNDIWNTGNGDIWILNSTSLPFSPRGAMAGAFFADRIWLLGGGESLSNTAQFRNDVWSSNDGINWYQVTENNSGSLTQFSPRILFKAVGTTEKLVIGGGERTNSLTNEVWSSQ